MKELSIEQKAKAYDEALKEAVVAHKDEDRHLKATLERIFPELKNDDERIKNGLLKLLNCIAMKEYKDTFCITKEEALAWLEKQGEQKSADKIEPKFKVGDVIRLKGSAAEYTIKRVTDTTYYTDGWSCSIERCEEDYELVEQKSTAWSEEDEMRFNNIFTLLEGLPLSQNWFKSLKDRALPQPKQEWSEEDETELTNIIIMLKEGASLHFNKKDITKAVDWLKSLRPQNRWKPSDEQIKALNYVVNLMASSERPTENDLYYNILKSLRQQLKKLKE